MIEIELTQGFVALIDDEDYERLMKINKFWYAHHSRCTFYAETKFNGIAIKMHRVVSGAKDGEQVDHKDGNGLNNQKANLRIATHAENMLNKRKYENNKSGVTGVYYFVPKKGLKHWHAQITRHGVQRSLGKFLTKEEAVAARLEAENAIAQAEAE